MSSFCIGSGEFVGVSTAGDVEEAVRYALAAAYGYYATTDVSWTQQGEPQHADGAVRVALTARPAAASVEPANESKELTIINGDPYLVYCNAKGSDLAYDFFTAVGHHFVFSVVGATSSATYTGSMNPAGIVHQYLDGIQPAGPPVFVRAQMLDKLKNPIGLPREIGYFHLMDCSKPVFFNFKSALFDPNLYIIAEFVRVDFLTKDLYLRDC